MSDTPSPHRDPHPPEGPGGPDAVPDWESAGPDPKVPDQPRSAQVEGMPGDIETPEELDESDGAGSHQAKDPADEGKETLTEPADEDEPPEDPA